MRKRTDIVNKKKEVYAYLEKILPKNYGENNLIIGRIIEEITIEDVDFQLEIIGVFPLKKTEEFFLFSKKRENSEIFYNIEIQKNIYEFAVIF